MAAQVYPTVSPPVLSGDERVDDPLPEVLVAWRAEEVLPSAGHRDQREGPLAQRRVGHVAIFVAPAGVIEPNLHPVAHHLGEHLVPVGVEALLALNSQQHYTELAVVAVPVADRPALREADAPRNQVPARLGERLAAEVPLLGRHVVVEEVVAKRQTRSAALPERVQTGADACQAGNPADAVLDRAPLRVVPVPGQHHPGEVRQGLGNVLGPPAVLVVDGVERRKENLMVAAWALVGALLNQFPLRRVRVEGGELIHQLGLVSLAEERLALVRGSDMLSPGRQILWAEEHSGMDTRLGHVGEDPDTLLIRRVVVTGES